MNSVLSPDGLVDGVGQELAPAGGQGSAPLKPQDGQWTFRFNSADTSKVSVFVTINFGAPISLTAEMSSEMNQSQVESLNQWLVRVLAGMKNSANIPSNGSLDGLTEGVGQELTPASGPGSSPLKPQDGQWTFRFNYADTSKVSVFVTINFGPPFSLSADLSSEMKQSQVESLNAWLARIVAAMKTGNSKPAAAPAASEPAS